MTKQPFTVADYLLTRLKQLNVTDVFQIPGDYVRNFTQALEHFNGVNTIGAINELDAAYAADAYARTRGLGAVSLQYGVSTFSALNAIAGAYVERSPVVVISATPGADARQITKMYDVLYHHSTGNIQTDQEVYEHVTVAAEDRQPADRGDHLQEAGLHRLLQRSVGRTLPEASQPCLAASRFQERTAGP